MKPRLLLLLSFSLSLSLFLSLLKAGPHKLGMSDFRVDKTRQSKTLPAADIFCQLDVCMQSNTAV